MALVIMEDIMVAVTIIIGMEITITTIITMEEEEVLVMLILQMEIEMVLEMVTEVQIILTEEAVLIQHMEIEIPIIIILDLLQPNNMLEILIIIQQELILIHNQQEVIVVNQLRYTPILQVLIPDHLHQVVVTTVVEVTVVEAAVVEDLHQAAEEDKKMKTQISMLLNKLHRYFFD